MTRKKMRWVLYRAMSRHLLPVFLRCSARGIICGLKSIFTGKVAQITATIPRKNTANYIIDYK